MKKKNGIEEMKMAIAVAVELLNQQVDEDGNTATVESMCADIIKNGTEQISKKSVVSSIVICKKCNGLYAWKQQCPHCGESTPSWSQDTCSARKTWTEHYEIQIVKVKSEPVFEKIFE